ncbi:uncharacterized protein [Amphiura filiformis]|uniref:uncharacterized protein n=1 Tax=Amphiura filiformis TaxID=82378 RepID=UPI003B211DA0
MLLCLNKNVYNQCVLRPSLRNLGHNSESGAEVRVAQHSMERSMLGITKRDRKPNEWIRSMTQVTDVIHTVKQRKLSWSGHLARNQWTMDQTGYRMDTVLGTQKGQKVRWRDENTKFLDVTWMRKTCDKHQFGITFGEAFTLHMGRRWLRMMMVICDS